MICVVGSGPAGVAAAMALLDRGQHVTLIDVGLELESERQAIVSRMHAQTRFQWSAADVQAVRANTVGRPKGIPLKYIYGSDYAYQRVESATPMEKHGVDTSASFARGGLSTVWGADVMPYCAADTADWPVTVDELAPHYAEVFKFVPLSAQRDDLASTFPLYTENFNLLRPSRQATAFLADLNRRREKLNQAGIRFGAARLAVRAQPGR